MLSKIAVLDSVRSIGNLVINRFSISVILFNKFESEFLSTGFTFLSTYDFVVKTKYTLLTLYHWLHLNTCMTIKPIHYHV